MNGHQTPAPGSSAAPVVNISAQDLMNLMGSMATSISALTASVQALVNAQANNVNTSSSASGSRSIVEKPVIFKGKDSESAHLFRSAFRVWINANEDRFALRDAQGKKVQGANGATMLDVHKMVPSALFFIAEDAAVWARPHIESLAEGKTPFASWDAFLVAFKLKFELVSPEADTKNKIIGIKQGKRTFGELVADFETWASQTGWSKQDLFDHLKQTLNADYINRLSYFPVVAKDYNTLKAYGHSIDLQLTDLHNNQRQAGATGNNSSSAPCSAPGFRDPNAMDIDANNIDSHFQGLSNEDVVKKWRKWMKDCCRCCGSKLHENSLEKHPGPLVCNHCSRTGHFSRVCLARLQGKPATQCAAATGPVSASSPAPATATIASSTSIMDYEAENAALKDSIAILTKQVQGLAEQVKQAF
jgi:hypothetical protein